jgi:hypothetical protein
MNGKKEKEMRGPGVEPEPHAQNVEGKNPNLRTSLVELACEIEGGVSYR